MKRSLAQAFDAEAAPKPRLDGLLAKFEAGRAARAPAHSAERPAPPARSLLDRLIAQHDVAMGRASAPPADTTAKGRQRLPCLADSFLANADRGLADLRAATAAASMRTRNAALAAEQTGLASAAKSMAPIEYALAARHAIAIKRLNVKRCSALRTYEAYYRGHGLEPPLPIRVDNVISYIGHAVEVKGNASHAAAQTVSNLRNAAIAIGKWAVDAADELLIAAHVDNMCEAMPSKPRHGEGVDAVAVARACKRLRSEGTLTAMQTRAQMSLSVGFFMRGTELAHKSGAAHTGLRAGDVETNATGSGLKAVLHKTDQRSLRPTHRACPHLPEMLAELCPTRCYSEYVSALAKAGRTLREGDYLWPLIEERPWGSVVTDRPLLSDASQRNMMSQLRQQGVDTSRLDKHWGRHSGSDMYRDHVDIGEKLPEKMGGWSVDPEAQRAKRRTKAKCYSGNSGGLPIKTLLKRAQKRMRKSYPTVCCTCIDEGQGTTSTTL